MWSLNCLLLELYVLVLLARMVLSWFPVPYDGPMATVHRVLAQLTEPVLAPIRSVVRPVSVGGLALDLAPLLLLLGISLVTARFC